MNRPEAIPVRTLRNDVSEILRRVEAGESFEVTRHGHVVARLVPNVPLRRPGTLADFERLRDDSPADPELWSWLRQMRDASPARNPFEGQDRWT